MHSQTPWATQSWYFIGIGGVSMSALALILKDFGAHVRGSDAQESNFTAALRERGVPAHIGEDEEITEDCVVYTGAVHEEHPQLAAARRAGKRLYTRAELLGKVAEGYSHVLSVAGCHGKTTTSCMLAHILHANHALYASHIGGEDAELGNYSGSGREYFVTDACEFKRSFLSLHSDVAVILNCDRDHTDCYRDEEELFSAYRQFAAQAKHVVVNADDPRANRIPHTISYGFHAGDIRAEQLFSEGERYTFTVNEHGIPVIRIRMNILGKVHIYNALASYAVARLIGFNAEEIKRGIESFRGVKRRFERVGTLGGAEVFCDYAHHPSEIAATLATAEKLCAGTVRLVFQPHTYTRTRDFMKEFVAVLKRAENPIIYRTYSAREPFEFDGSAVALASRVPKAVYVQSPEQLKVRLLQSVKTDDLILVLGAGDIYEIAKQIVEP